MAQHGHGRGGGAQGGGGGRRYSSAASTSAHPYRHSYRSNPMRQSLPDLNSNHSPIATYLHAITDPRFFKETLQQLHSVMGINLPIPVVEGLGLDLHRLFLEVTYRGGIQKVTEDRKLEEVCAVFPAVRNADTLLRLYNHLLYQYELLYFRGDEDRSSPSAASQPGSSARLIPVQGVARPGLGQPNPEACVVPSAPWSSSFAGPLPVQYHPSTGTLPFQGVRRQQQPFVEASAFATQQRPPYSASQPGSSARLIPVQRVARPEAPIGATQQRESNNVSLAMQVPYHYHNATDLNTPSTGTLPYQGVRRQQQPFVEASASATQQRSPYSEARVVATQQREQNNIYTTWPPSSLQRPVPAPGQLNNAISGNSPSAVVAMAPNPASWWRLGPPN